MEEHRMQPQKILPCTNELDETGKLAALTLSDNSMP